MKKMYILFPEYNNSLTHFFWQSLALGLSMRLQKNQSLLPQTGIPLKKFHFYTTTSQYKIVHTLHLFSCSHAIWIYCLLEVLIQ